MKRFVFGTGLISLFAGIALQSPRIAALLMPSEKPGMLMHLFGLMAAFLGVMLVFCAKDLAHRGNLVLWEGVLRIGGFAVMAGYGIFGKAGLLVAASGLFDLVVGIIYLVWLPRSLGVGFLDLLLDRNSR